MNSLSDLPAYQLTAQLVLSWLFNAVVYGTALALVTWALVQLFLRRARPALHAALWMIVLVKFILPLGPAWDFSLANSLSTLAKFAMPAAPGAAPSSPPPLVHPGTAPPLDWMPITAFDAAQPPPAAPQKQTASGWSVLALLGVLYGIGLLCVGAYRLRQYRRFATYCRRLPAADEATRGAVYAVCRLHGVQRLPSVRMSSNAPAPFIFGMLEPTLVLSPRQLADTRELEAVVLHEIAHLRRGDLLVRYLQCLAGTALFFWPVVAWVNRRIDLAREQACDEWALRHARISPGDYARCLLRALHPSGSPRTSYCPTAMAASLKTVERRIDMILTSPVRRGVGRSIGLPAGALLLAWAGFGLTGAGAASTKDNADAAPPSAAKTESAMSALHELLTENIGPEMHELVARLHGRLAELHHGLMSGDNAPQMHFAFEWNDEDDGPIAIPVDGEEHAIGVLMFHSDDDAPDADEPQTVFMHRINGPGDEDLAGFATQHPTADVNGDGAVSREERDAYVVALAMSDPTSVMNQYPKSDRNADSRLDANEAARLVQGGPMIDQVGANVMRFKTRHVGGADDNAAAEVEAIAIAGSELPAADRPGAQRKVVRVIRKGDGTQEVTVNGQPADEAQLKDIIIECPDDAAPGGQRVIKRIRVNPNGDDSAAPQMFEKQICLDGADAGSWMSKLGAPPAIWILDNVDGSPTSADVARYVDVARQAPLALFLEMNPKADANGDGVLVESERDAFLESHTSKMRAEMLKRFPEADANSDGALSREEMDTFFHSRHGGGAAGAWQGADGRHMIVRKFQQGDAASGEMQIRVEVSTDEDDADAPK
ncbi:Regulatory protein BlaR1 [Phycisphaerae bacterium RAS1]|nr:Regulatory protein BlaR1 [Phycisphaerae bacterium RAS1]